MRRFYWRLKSKNGDSFSLGFDDDKFEKAEQKMLTFCKIYDWVPVEYEGWEDRDDKK